MGDRLKGKIRGAHKSILVLSTPKEQTTLEQYFTQAKFSVQSVADEEEALEVSLDTVRTLVVCESLFTPALARHFSPVLLLVDSTPTDSDWDEFVKRPLQQSELIARLRALLNRTTEQNALIQTNSDLHEEQQRRRELAAIVVHDMRNPLSAIDGNKQLLEQILFDSMSKQQTLPTLELQTECLHDIGELCNKALRMLNSLLDLEELEAGLLVAECQSVAIDSLISNLPKHYQTVLQARKLQLRIDAPTDEAQVNIDLGLLTRVIEHLLDNAVRYAPRASAVTLKIDTGSPEVLGIEVSNEGVPIPPDDREHIFDKYYRVEASRENRGRGLGLYFCKLAVHAHQGDISLLERNGHTVFSVRIPQ